MMTIVLNFDERSGSLNTQANFQDPIRLLGLIELAKSQAIDNMKAPKKSILEVPPGTKIGRP